MTDALKTVSKPHTIYKNAEGKRLCGVTTILSILNKPALVAWANRLGLDGIDSSKYVDESARIGTLIHYMVECDLTGQTPDMETYSPFEVDKAENGILSFYEWKKAHIIIPIANELPLVSEQYQYGGTIDVYAEINGDIWLLDIKSGKAIYSDMLIQIAAYRQLLNENGYPCERAKILRIGRDETEGFEERTLTSFDKYWQVFEHCLQIYRLQKEIGG